MISTLRLKFGAKPKAMEASIAIGPLTLLIGPNNSGKSRALSEIVQYCRSGVLKDSVIVESMDFIAIPESDIEVAFPRFSGHAVSG